MNPIIKDYILAIVTSDPDKVISGGCPVFIAQDQAEMEKLGLYLARIVGGVVHDLENGVYCVVKH